MDKKLKSLPIVLMLSTGAVTSIITYSLNYDGKTALLILLGVLLFFYITGSMFSNMIFRFEKEQEEIEREKRKREGMVVEKEPGSEQEEGSASKESSENYVKDAGEQ